ncbi:molybdenum cofactor sulfurase 3 [Phymastichus coffea]|uniref:molybdenum cofactor sulfurase 3 n=1 Tax=Phymastichus coffea TaxID=108790 RepID=UPI00273AC974|nr:molybdenum cofactor sulfurase 3 [Phymastichus coffea]
MDELSYTPVYDDKTHRNLEQKFSRIKGECYVDHAGSTLYSDNQIKESLDDLLTSLYTNPHSHGVNGNITEETIDNIRYIILDHFHTTQDEYSVIFTSGATASLKLLAETFSFRTTQNESNGKYGNFVYLQDNHTSVLGMRELVLQKGANVVCIDHKNAYRILEQNFDSNYSIEKQSNSLFVYSAQCNFSGLKYPLSWIDKVKSGYLNSYVGNESNWFIMLDAASFAATNDLNLSVYKPDFVCLSFYKLFGYPTGIGALLVKNSSAGILNKTYYGGGTVNLALSSKMYHVNRKILHERFEDGTISFLTIISLRYGFKLLSEISMPKISLHVFSLARCLYKSLLMLHHQNGAPVVKLYSDTDYENIDIQGGVVTFNILRANEEYIGFMEVLNMAALHKIHLRTGCFCNPGACQRHMNLSDIDILKNYDTGYTCGGTVDLIDGKPTGAVRISFGYMSTISDVKTILTMIRKCFVKGKEVIKYPLWWHEFQEKIRVKYKAHAAIGCYNNSVNREFTADESLIDVINENMINKICFTQNIISNFLDDKAIPRLSKVFIYPVKSCGAYEIENCWKVTSKGLQYDREWMIVTSLGVCLTQKQETKLCLLMPVVDLKHNVLKLNYPNMPTIDVPLIFKLNQIRNSKICRGKICGHKVEGIDCGIEVSEWLSLALGRPNLRLVRQCEAVLQKVDKPELSFASQSQYLLINNSSIQWLSDKIEEDLECDKNTLLHRFRGNFIVDGCIAFEETKWSEVKIGNCHFKVEGVCTRCQMVCIDQLTGKKTIEPLRTLAEEFHGKLKFGIYLVNEFQENDVLKIGDRLFYH